MSQVESMETIRENKQIKETMEKYLMDLIDSAENYAKMDSVDQSVIESYITTAKDIIQLENELDGHLMALDKARANPSVANDVEEFKKEYSNIVNQNKHPIDNNNQTLKKLQKVIWKGMHGDEPFPGEDEDIVVEDDFHNFICPLTKKRYVDPVKSRVCGHTFSKEAIYNLIGRKNCIKCPVAGCDKMFGRNELVDDIEMKHAMEKDMKNMSESSSSSDDDIIV